MCRQTRRRDIGTCFAFLHMRLAERVARVCSIEMRKESIAEFEFPKGSYWVRVAEEKAKVEAKK